MKVQCRDRMQPLLATHVAPVLYLSYTEGISMDLGGSLGLQLGWPTLAGQRAVSRFRAALLELGHNAGHRSRARVTSCVACAARVHSVFVHCLVECDAFDESRLPLVQYFGSRAWSQTELTRQLLGLRPGHIMYPTLVALLVEVERKSDLFWRY